MDEFINTNRDRIIDQLAHLFLTHQIEIEEWTRRAALIANAAAAATTSEEVAA